MMRLVVVTGLLFAALLGSPARANGRHFLTGYESAVLAPGAAELEPWVTWRWGRQAYYHRYDLRLETELGLTEGLQGSFYLNATAKSWDAQGARASAFEFGGVDVELKYKWLDPVADVVGLATYLEVGAGPDEAKLEARLIVDKRLGPVLAMVNGKAEYEVGYGTAELEHEVVLEVDAGVAYLLTPELSLGLELRSHNLLQPEVGLAHAALFAGPVASYARGSWWLAVALLPQLPAPLAAGDRNFVLDDLEQLQARVIVGCQL